MTTLQEAHPAQARRWNLEAVRARLADSSRTRYALYMYLASRVLYLVIAAIALALIDTVGSHTALAQAHNWQGHPLDTSSLGTMMSNWDGKWYLLTAATWYYHHVDPNPGSYTTLGFMPLYPMVIWLVAHVLPIGNLGAGLAVSMISGGIATVLISQLAEEWWGEEVARRAIRFWCFFPGTIVFSMVYSEGLTLSLIAGSMLLLHRKRWLWAGVLAGSRRRSANLSGRRADVCGGCAARASQPRLARPRGAEVIDRPDPLTARRDRLRHLPVDLDRLAALRLQRTAPRMVGVDDAARDPARAPRRDPPAVHLRCRIARPRRYRPQLRTGVARNRIHGVWLQAALGPPLSRTRDRLGVDGVRLGAGADLSQDATESASADPRLPTRDRGRQGARGCQLPASDEVQPAGHDRGSPITYIGMWLRP